MTQFASRVSPSIPKARPIPPLENGDQLTADEFERRWDAMPDLNKAELIDGTVYMPPPALSHDFHSAPHFDLITVLGVYRMATPGVAGGDNGSVKLDFKNIPQPDIYLLIEPSHGGQSKKVDGFITGAPEFVVEIANTSASYDSHQKLEVYRRFGVKEYIIWRTLDAEIDVRILENGQYKPAAIPADGIFRSYVLPGLWLNVAAILAGDWTAVLQQMQLGIASAEHADFVAQLQKAFGESKARA